MWGERGGQRIEEEELGERTGGGRSRKRENWDMGRTRMARVKWWWRRVSGGVCMGECACVRVCVCACVCASASACARGRVWAVVCL
jgi:hypothetical protein